MRAIKGLTVLALLAAIGWGAYWFIGARALDRAITAGLAHVPELSADSHSVRGFPNRFDVTFDNPRIAAGGIEWQAPFVQVFALSYRLNHLLAVFAHDQALSIGGTPVSLHTDDLRASLVMTPGLDLPLDRLTLIGEALHLQGTGTSHRIDSLRIASRRQAGEVHQLAMVAEGVFPDPSLMALIDPQALWPQRYDRLRLDGEAEFDAALDRHLFTGRQPRLTRLVLTGGQAGWDGGEIVLAGRLVPGPGGALAGEMTASITGWEPVLARLNDAGLLTEESLALLHLTLGAVAAEGDGNRLDVPLSVVAGEIWLGPVLLGFLPPLPFGLR